jgi:hypothetical protein
MSGDWAGASGTRLKQYERGAWGAGSKSIEKLRKSYGLGSEATGSKENDIYGRLKDGTKVFIGSVQNQSDLRDNDDLISAHAEQSIDEIDHSSVPESLSSHGDVRGAILNLWDGKGDEVKKEIAEAKSETFDTQIPDQIVNARNTIQDFNDNYSKIWSQKTAAQNNNSFLDEYTFAGKKMQGNGSNMKVSMTTQWAEGATDHSVGAGETTFKYANARDRAQSFSNQQVPGETLGMP